jgi:hypothetical protein
MRTRNCSPAGHSWSASWRCISSTAATHALGEVNVAKKESPGVGFRAEACEQRRGAFDIREEKGECFDCQNNRGMELGPS